MSGKKFLLILGALATLSFGVSLGLSVLLGGDEPAPPKPAAAKPQPKSQMLLAELGAAKAPPSLLAKQHELEELIKDLQRRVVEYERKEEKLQEQAKRIATAEEGLARRAEEIKALTTTLAGRLLPLKDELAKLRQAQVVVDRERRVNQERVAASYDTMDSVEAADIFTEMDADGQTEDVVTILYYMSERTSAGVLSSIKDKKLAAKLTRMMQTISEQG